MAEEDPAIGGVKVLPVVQLVRGGDPRIVQAQHPRGEERRVIPVGDREDRQGREHPPCGVHGAF